MSHGRKLAVIGLGYVGLPVAVAFARNGAPVVGFDITKSHVNLVVLDGVKGNTWEEAVAGFLEL